MGAGTWLCFFFFLEKAEGNQSPIRAAQETSYSRMGLHKDTSFTPGSRQKNSEWSSLRLDPAELIQGNPFFPWDFLFVVVSRVFRRLSDRRLLGDDVLASKVAELALANAFRKREAQPVSWSGDVAAASSEISKMTAVVSSLVPLEGREKRGKKGTSPPPPRFFFFFFPQIAESYRGSNF